MVSGGREVNTSCCKVNAMQEQTEGANNKCKQSSSASGQEKTKNDCQDSEKGYYGQESMRAGEGT